MQRHESASDPTPPDCFRLEEIQTFQAFETQLLAVVNYYLWLNRSDPEAGAYRFLYCLELIFDNHPEVLLLSSGEDSAAIRLIGVETLIKTAHQLQTLHGQVSIQRVNAGAFPLWEPVVNRALLAVRLSKNEAGLYFNDALLFDFGIRQIIVQLSRKEGLELGIYGEKE